MKLFVRNAPAVEPEDWTLLSERLMERSRIPDVVRVCEIGGVPLPRARMLALADEHLRRKDVDTAIRLYELAGADHDRWARLVDVLTGLPDRERLAIEVTERHLDPEATSRAPCRRTRPASSPSQDGGSSSSIRTRARIHPHRPCCAHFTTPSTIACG